MHFTATNRQSTRNLLFTAIAIQLLVASLGVFRPTWFGYPDKERSFCDVTIYRDYAWRMARGEVPYRDFLVEYPPLALPLFALPLPAEKSVSTVIGVKSLVPLAVYGITFAGLMIFTSAILSAIIARQAEANGDEASVRSALGWYSAFFISMSPLVVTRFDLFPTALSFGAVASFATGRFGVGGFLTALGALTKFVPGIVLLPTLAASNRVVPFGGKMRATLVTVLTFGLGLVLWGAVGRHGFLESIRYHTDRGLEMGSTWTGVFLMLHSFAGYPTRFRFDHSSAGVDTPHSELAAKLAMPVMLVCFAIVAWRSWRGRMTPLKPFRLAAAILIAYMITNKVLSPQYLIWVFPFVALAGTGLERMLFLGCCVVTTISYPWNTNALFDLTAKGAILTVGRNAGLMLLFFLFLRDEDPAVQPTEIQPAQG